MFIGILLGIFIITVLILAFITPSSASEPTPTAYNPNDRTFLVNYLKQHPGDSLDDAASYLSFTEGVAYGKAQERIKNAVNDL